MTRTSTVPVTVGLGPLNRLNIRVTSGILTTVTQAKPSIYIYHDIHRTSLDIDRYPHAYRHSCIHMVYRSISKSPFGYRSIYHVKWGSSANWGLGVLSLVFLSKITSGILTPCRNAIYHAYTCICMFEIMHVSIYYAYTCIYMQ